MKNILGNRGVLCVAILLSAMLTTMDTVEAQSVAEYESFYNDFDKRPQDKVELLVKYAPRVYMAVDEEYYPASVDWFFEYTKRIRNIPIPCDNRISFAQRVHFCLTPAVRCNWDCSPQRIGSKTYLKTKEKLDSPSDDTLHVFGGFDGRNGRPALHKAPVYAYWSRQGKFVDLIYFFFYPYNRGKEVLATVYGSHVGDWERIYVRLEPVFRSGKMSMEPKLVNLAAHSDTGKDHTFDTFQKFDGTHPIVYEAWGSHGLWPSAGSHEYDSGLADEASAGIAWDTWKNVVSFDVLRKESLPSGKSWPLWMRGEYHLEGGVGFPVWRWGNRKDGAVIDFGEEASVPYRLEDGPTGPETKPPMQAKKLSIQTEICNDGIDNDGDLAVDCDNDADCPRCVPIPKALHYTVTTLADSGNGSLREAIDRLTSPLVTGLTIYFDPALDGKTITLTSGQLTIAKKHVKIDAESGLVEGITLSGNHATRVFEVSAGGKLDIYGLTITAGNAKGPVPGDRGGAIFNRGGCVYLTRSTIYGNAATVGGGIFSTMVGIVRNPHCDKRRGETYLLLTTVAENKADSNGGGLLNEGSDVELDFVTFAANSAGVFGGGIDNASGVLKLGNTIVAGNTAGSDPGSGPDIGNRDGGKIVHNYSGINSNLIGSNDTVTLEFPSDGVHVGTFESRVDPRLAPLDDYGGLTRTMIPLAESPAVDAGKLDSLYSCSRGGIGRADHPFLGKDQRRFPASGRFWDIGAVESTTPYANVVLADRPVNYYRFEGGVNEAARDSARLTCAKDPVLADWCTNTSVPVTNRPATIKGGVSLGKPSASTRLGSAALFKNQKPSGVSVSRRAPPPLSCAGDGTEISVEAWVKLDPHAPGSHFIIAGSSDHDFEIAVNADGQAYFGFRYGISGFASSENKLTRGEWHHVVGTADSGRAQFYVDGVRQNEGIVPVGLDLKLIGRELQIGGNYFPGVLPGVLIDEVAFYQHTLSDRQIQTHFLFGMSSH